MKTKFVTFNASKVRKEHICTKRENIYMFTKKKAEQCLTNPNRHPTFIVDAIHIVLRFVVQSRMQTLFKQ